MNILVIIVTFNGKRWYNRCFDSLRKSEVKVQPVVIDNGSTDGTPEFIKENYPEFILVEAGENLGFAKANNIGMKYALEHDADYVFLLNQDAWIEPDTITKLVEVFQSLPDAGIISPVHLNGNKTALDIGFANYISSTNTPDFVDDLFFNRLKAYYKTSFVNAAAWLISRRCIETVGGFDTSVFYHYGEDYHYCQRVIYHQLKVYIATGTTVCHDRQDRKGKRPGAHENLKEDVGYRGYLANILYDDRIVDDAISLARKRFLIKLLKFFVKLKFKKAFTCYRTDYRQEINLYLCLVKSRNLNKQGGLVWLNDDIKT